MEVHVPEPPEKPVRRNGQAGFRLFEVLFSLTALVISGASMFSAYHTGQAMERLVHANSWPFLHLDSGNVTEAGLAEIVFSARNAGTGPARIHSFEFLVDGVAVPRQGNEVANIMRACCETELNAALAATGGSYTEAVGQTVTNLVPHRFMSPGEEVVALRWPPPRAPESIALWRAVDQARQSRRISTRACYCSVFDECWVAETNVFPPRHVARCAPEQAAPIATPAQR